MTPYPHLQVRFKPQKGQLSFQGFDLSGQGLVLFFLPHSSVRDLSPGTNAAAQHRQQKPWATTSPSKLLSHSGIEIWLLDGKQKTLMLTTTPKSASAALGTFPRVSRTGSQQAELFGGNSTSYLTPLCDYHKDTGMVRASSHPPWGQCSVSCSDGLVKKSFLGRSQWHREASGSFAQSSARGPEWKFHTRNRNLPVKHCNKFKQTNKNLLQLQMFSEHLQGKSGEARLAWVWCLCLNCQIILLFSPGAALGSLSKESTNSLAQNSAVERTCYSSWFKCKQQLGKTVLCCSDTEKMQKKEGLTQEWFHACATCPQTGL